MRNILLILLTCISINVVAQKAPDAQADLFSKLPSTINIAEPQLEYLFTHAEKMTVHLDLANGFAINGTVFQKQSNAPNIQTMAIMLPQFKGAIFGLAKITLGNKEVVYNGSFTNSGFGTGYQLKKQKEGTYQLIKIESKIGSVDNNRQ